MDIIGYVDEISNERVVGWLADKDDLDNPIQVSILRDGKEITRAMADIPREDLRQALGSANHGFVVALPPPATNRATHILVCTPRREPLPQGEAVLPPNGGASASAEAANGNALLRPILITSTARSGTTILAKRLSSHPRISVGDFRPYEVKLVTYYAAAFRVLTAPWRGPEAERTRLIDGLGNERFAIQRNPFFHQAAVGAFDNPRDMYDYFLGTGLDVYRDSFSRLIDGYYRKIAEQKRKMNVTYFLEKCEISGDTRHNAYHIFPNILEIILIRDVRDILCSRRSFFNEDPSTQSAVKQSIDALLRLWRERTSHMHFLRYEDFIQDEQTTLNNVAEFLGIESFSKMIHHDDRDLFKVHGTSTSAESSIGRWRKDLPPREQQNCRNDYRSFLEAFDYPLE